MRLGKERNCINNVKKESLVKKLICYCKSVLNNNSNKKFLTQCRTKPLSMLIISRIIISYDKVIKNVLGKKRKRKNACGGYLARDRILL